MNYKNIKNFLKKNYKKIIVVCLIMLLLSNKMYEKFSTTQALDAVKSTEKKVNEMVSKVDRSHVRFPKKVVLDKGLAMGALKMAPGNWLDYGIEVPAGKKVGIHAPGNGTMELHVDNKLHTGEIHAASKICIGGACITKAHIDLLKGDRHFFLANSHKNRFLKQEGDIHAWKAEFKPGWADERKRLYIFSHKGHSDPAF